MKGGKRQLTFTLTEEGIQLDGGGRVASVRSPHTAMRAPSKDHSYEESENAS